MSRGQRLRSSRRGGSRVGSVVLQLTPALLSAFLTVFLARRLGPMDYGLFALAIAIGTIVLVLADAASSTARFLVPAEPDSDLRGLIVGTLEIRVVVVGLMSALLVALASVIAGAYRHADLVWPLRAAAVATFAQTAYLAALGIFTALGRTSVAVRIEAAERVAEVSASVALVLAGAGASGAVFGRAIGYAPGAVVAASLLLGAALSAGLTSAHGPRSMASAAIFGHVAPLLAIDRSDAVARSVTVLLLGASVGPFASGIFMAPAALAVVVRYIGRLTATRVTPRLTNGVPQPLDGTLRALIVFQCAMLAPVVVWARPITELLFGSGYSQSAEILRALAPFVFFAGIAPLVARAVDRAEESRRASIYVVSLALAVAAGFILIPRRGVVGGAIACDVAIGFYTLAHIWICRRRFNLRIRTLMWGLASALTAAAAMGIVLASVGTKDLTLVDWVKGCCGGLAAYLAMLMFTREITTAQVGRAASVVTDRLGGRRPSPTRDEYPPAPRQAATAAAPLSVDTPSRTALSDAARRATGASSTSVSETEDAAWTYRRADAAGDAGGAFNLGVLLHQRGDFVAAAAAYERAELRGDRDAAFNLGTLLYEQGDLDGAEAAWRRCLRRQHVPAAANLGFLLERRGDLEGARAAYAAAERWADAERAPSGVEEPVSPTEDAELNRRADAAGDARGAFNLGVLLHQRRDFAAAAAAYERAELRGDRDAAFNLGILLYEQGDLDGAEAAWRRCLSRQHVQAAANLGFLLQRRGDPEGARAAYAAAERWADATPSG
jgi:O-antigen/teichoic acid export membrane protein/tetratricopeptide (TPR) repeat protein